jgi:hypothetical protein
MAALFATERFTVQPVATSVIVSVKQNSPKLFVAFVTDQIDLHEPGGVLVPFRSRPDRDLRLEQRSRFGVRPAREPGDDLGVGEAPVDRRR